MSRTEARAEPTSCCIPAHAVATGPRALAFTTCFCDIKRLRPRERRRLTTTHHEVNWPALLAPYRTSSIWRSLFQLANTFIPFVALWVVMAQTLGAIPYVATLALAVPTALLLVRLFILQHDCGHGSFFRSRRMNNAVGFCIGVMTLVPYTYWRKTHAIHHATSGNLDHRSFGDIDTLTVREYLSLSKTNRFRYRLYRHPLVLLVVGPIYQFIFKHRFPADTPKTWKREWASVHLTNLAIAVVIALLWWAVGIRTLLLVQIPITVIAGSVGVFLFYVQHQYEDTYWRYRETWDYYQAGLEGSSHMVLPKVLQWFAGNIGLHHIHHVCSRIPNYHLQRCYDENPELHTGRRLGLWSGIKTLNKTLWDEDTGRLIRFRDVPAVRRRIASDDVPVEATKPDVIPRTWG